MLLLRATCLLVWRLARQIRIDRPVVQAEVMRGERRDRDGSVLFEGEVR